jgi:hypothetical protein
MESKDFRRVFSHRDYWCFDECAFLWRNLLRGDSLDDLNAVIDSMTHVVSRTTANGTIRSKLTTLVEEQIEYDSTGRLPWRNYLRWEKGKLLDSRNKSKAYFHFHVLKRTSSFGIPRWYSLPENFFITSKGFSRYLPPLFTSYR